MAAKKQKEDKSPEYQEPVKAPAPKPVPVVVPAPVIVASPSGMQPGSRWKKH